MANKILWDAGVSTKGAVVDFNSTNNDARTNAGTEVDNSVNLDQYGFLKIDADFGSAPSDGYPTLDIYLMKALDGTNYEDGSSSVVPSGQSFLASVPVRKVDTAQIPGLIGPFLLPPCKIKFIVENQTGQATGASGNTLTLYTANDEVQ
jgi:hypothetical protein